MNPEAMELRKKVILARFAVLGIVLLCIAIWIFSQWAASDSAAVGNAENALKNHPNQQAILDSLHLSEKLAKEGKQDLLNRVLKAVDSALKSQSKGGPALAKANLELAASLQKSGALNMSFAYALKGLQSLSPKQRPASLSSEELSLMETAADIMLKSKNSLSVAELPTVTALALSTADPNAFDSRDRIYDLIIDAQSKASLPVTDDLLSCMFAKELVLARRGQLKELESNVKKSMEAAKVLAAGAALREAPAPCLPQHAADLAFILQKLSPESSQKYLSMAEESLATVDPASESAGQLIVHANCLNRLSQACLGLGEQLKGVDYARQSAKLRPLQDVASAAAWNQLIQALITTKSTAEAAQIAGSMYKFYNLQDPKNTEMSAMRSAFIAEYFQVLIAQHKNMQALSMMNTEIKLLSKELPAAARKIVDLNSMLCDYYLDRRELRYAATCAGKIAELSKNFQGDEKLRIQMMLVNYGTKTRSPELTVNACTEALAYIDKNKQDNIDQETIDGLCSALDNLKKANADDVYKHAVEIIKAGFTQQLLSADADPIALAKVVNILGTSGEEKVADSLRSEAVEKLPQSKGPAFLAQSMDFVVSGEKDTAQYAGPLQAVKVYLDLAHNMQNKDDEQAAKYSFEALKIIHLIISKSPELREPLIDNIDEASGIMVGCKKNPDAEQLKVLLDMAGMEADAIKKSGKDRLLELAIKAQLKNNVAMNEQGLDCILLRNETLAKRGQVALLDGNVSKTKDLLSEYQSSKLSLAKHWAQLANLLAESQQTQASRKYLNMSKRVLEEIPEEQVSQRPGDLAQLWERLSDGYSKAGDAATALACARRSVSMRPAGSPASNTALMNLLDRLIDAGNFSEAEPIALEISKAAKSQGLSAQVVNLRAQCARKLFRIYKEEHKDAQAIAIMQDELNARRQMANAQAAQTADMYFDLAKYFVAHQDLSSADQCLQNLAQAKTMMKAEQRAAWIKSNAQREFINLTLSANDTKLASEAVNELAGSVGIDKAALLHGPDNWWSTVTGIFKKAGDDAAVNQMLSLVKDGFSQQLSRPSNDPAFLAKVVNEVSAFGDDKTSASMQTEAARKLSAANRAAFISKLSNPIQQSAPTAETKDPAATPSNSPEAAPGRVEVSDH
ncbi:MAG: hypothetical protein K2X27_19700 [Candidatus Obscuribacterales bacterium]|nr:hypothetical protein [Candidatus Obscuribacterales bacterium]